jgi:3-phosphoshikimate 1-carboxyvinyltransferase
MASKEPVIVDDAEMIDTSFPGFVEAMRSLGADVAEA